MPPGLVGHSDFWLVRPFAVAAGEFDVAGLREGLGQVAGVNDGDDRVVNGSENIHTTFVDGEGFYIVPLVAHQQADGEVADVFFGDREKIIVGNHQHGTVGRRGQ